MVARTSKAPTRARVTLYSMALHVDSVFLNGTVGSGKTTVASAISAMETTPHAVIDLDAIRQFSPSSDRDPFNHELELENLASLAANFRRAGAQRFVLAGVIEDSNEVDRYVDALRSEGMFLFRLTATPDVLNARLVQRHTNDPIELAWHLSHVGQLTQILDTASIDMVSLDTSVRSPEELAAIIRREIGWV